MRKENVPKVGILKGVIGSFLDELVKVPAFETVEKDFYVQDKIANLLLLLNITNDCIIKNGLNYDKKKLQQLSQDEIKQKLVVLNESLHAGHISPETKEFLRSNSSNKHLFAYFRHEFTWVAVSIFSASYISANIIMRSLFELLVEIATNMGQSKMRSRIDSIPYLTPEENLKLKKLWKELNEWTHPTEHNWEKKVCPIFVSQKPMYHPDLCKQSLDTFESIIDFFILISLEKFEININDVLKEIERDHMDISNLTFLQRRL